MNKCLNACLLAYITVSHFCLFHYLHVNSRLCLKYTNKIWKIIAVKPFSSDIPCRGKYYIKQLGISSCWRPSILHRAAHFAGWMFIIIEMVYLIQIYIHLSERIDNRVLFPYCLLYNNFEPTPPPSLPPPPITSMPAKSWQHNIASQILNKEPN